MGGRHCSGNAELWMASLGGLFVLGGKTVADLVTVDELRVGAAPVARATGAGFALPELILG